MVGETHCFCCCSCFFYQLLNHFHDLRGRCILQVLCLGCCRLRSILWYYRWPAVTKELSLARHLHIGWHADPLSNIRQPMFTDFCRTSAECGSCTLHRTSLGEGVLTSHHHRPGQVSLSPLALASFLQLPAQDASSYEPSCMLFTYKDCGSGSPWKLA